MRARGFKNMCQDNSMMPKRYYYSFKQKHQIAFTKLTFSSQSNNTSSSHKPLNTSQHVTRPYPIHSVTVSVPYNIHSYLPNFT